MNRPKNNQEFYNSIEGMCLRLRHIGWNAEADIINHRLKVTWTTSTELFDELELVFKKILSGAKAAELPLQIRDELKYYIQLLETRGCSDKE